MNNKFDTLVVITPEDYVRLESQYPRLIKNINYGKIYFVGRSQVGDLVKKSGIAADYIDENSIIAFDEVHKVMEEHMKPILKGKSLPRGITGWYYQQFLKMQYAFICQDEYYMTWDGDTVPCKDIVMFKAGTGEPYIDLKKEYHKEYFETMGVIIPGLRKCIEKSFISEHMLFKTSIMKNLIEDIMANDNIEGRYFWEKIIHSIKPEKIQSSSFSEFETYGTYCCFNAADIYKLRDWHSFRLAGEFFDPMTITDKDYSWLASDFDAISFEKNQSVREDHKNLFNNPEYQAKLTPRKMLEEAQKEFKDGYLESWDDEEATSLSTENMEFMYYNNLGDYYVDINPNKAFLCYQQAEFICDKEEYKAALDNKMTALKQNKNVTVAKCAIIIVSYNCKYMMEKCIESIRNTCSREMVDIIVVDNASNDGVREYLEEQEDILLIKNNENLGFPKGCNIGIAAADEGQDIFLLNNDTRLVKNSLFWLRMGLYEDEMVGAVGATSNYCCDDQLKDVEFDSVEGYLKYGEKNNLAMEFPYEEKNRLSGFAMLIKRQALDKTPGLDERFSPGYFEDDDLSMGIHSLGFKLLVCHNAFIYHAGSQSFVKRNDLESIIKRNLSYIEEKWGYDSFGYAMVDKAEGATIGQIMEDYRANFNLLEIGAGVGNYLTRVKRRYPNANIYGIDNNEGAVWNSVKSVPILYLDFEKADLPFPDGFFDYIIYNNRFGKAFDREFVTNRLKKYMADDGKILWVDKVEE